MTSVQLVVVGSGPGGYAAAFLAADLGLSVALGSRTSFNLAYEHVLGDARGNITYHDNVFRVGFLFSY